MYTIFAKIKRPLLLSALVLGMGMGAVSAYDYCNPCRSRPKPKPVVVRSSCNPCASGVVTTSGYSTYTPATTTYSSTTYSAPSYAAPSYTEPVQVASPGVRVALNPGEEIPEVPGL